MISAEYIFRPIAHAAIGGSPDTGMQKLTATMLADLILPHVTR
jgi:hypothetical protein